MINKNKEINILYDLIENKKKKNQTIYLKLF